MIIDREILGKVVRQAWVDYCIETGRKDKNTEPWEQLDDWTKEVDRRIGESVKEFVVECILNQALDKDS